MDDFATFDRCYFIQSICTIFYFNVSLFLCQLVEWDDIVFEKLHS